MIRKITILITFVVACFSNLIAATPTTAKLDSCFNKAIEQRYFPGAQVVVGNSRGVLFSANYGYTDYSQLMKVDDLSLYDLASCTKIFATTLSVMNLVECGRLSLDSSIGELLELNDTLPCRNVRVRELLYHTSGFSPIVAVGTTLARAADTTINIISYRKSPKHPLRYDTNVYVAKDIVYDTTYVSRASTGNKIRIAKDLFVDRSFLPKLDSAILVSYKDERRGDYRYSDLNFYLLQKIVEKESSMPLDRFAQTIFDKMQLTDIGFNPLEWSRKSRICPTEYDLLFRRDTLQGVVHDDLAAVQGGVCGNAGLFGTASSLANICAMLLRGGTDYCGTRVFMDSTIEQFTKLRQSPKRNSNDKWSYSLGFTKVNNPKRSYTPQSYGHSGYTGTYFWVDPTQDLYLVILSNRVHPTRTNKQFNPEYREKIWALAAQIFGRFPDTH